MVMPGIGLDVDITYRYLQHPVQHIGIFNIYRGYFYPWLVNK